MTRIEKKINLKRTLFEMLIPEDFEILIPEDFKGVFEAGLMAVDLVPALTDSISCCCESWLDFESFESWLDFESFAFFCGDSCPIFLFRSSTIDVFVRL